MKTKGFAHVTATLALREQSHRRGTLLAIGALLLLSTSPVFGHHLPLNIDALLAGIDHVGALCVTALHILLAPVHNVFHAIMIGGLLYAVGDRLRAWRSVQQMLEPLDARLAKPGDPFWDAAAAAGVDPRRLRIVAGLPNPAFTVGLLTPRIYVAEALSERLSAAELAAVLAHEGAHVARRDPLRLSVLRALACTLFWIPALRRFADDMGDEVEVLADDVAAEGHPLVLASAILALAQWPHAGRPLQVAVGFDRPGLLERRIRRLAGEDTPVFSHVTRRSILGAALALALVWTSGVLMAHPLPSVAHPDHGRHCEHRHEFALTHLFCLGSPVAPLATDCPHRSH